ncbi:RIP metalloprotease RseP [Rhodanobacter sp. 7MK24]|uniref:RIP metalloprotease RseP n=1 Tax=Rhodanobacter sp. 7MK24 TaxID=2775922 RepID=UPI00177AA6A8|nr:RIP metalloprotease RseP [Rhodanobacter sp. 7MK24]MBD8879181.1 RIP metalloprotease RseP [Rhodanobacter sp. 7MK24]
MTSFFGSVFWLLVTLGVLVTFHEFGHYWVARRCGVRVLRFSVGFGKALWKRTGRDGCEYQIAAIPLGGYVKMLDAREGAVPPQFRDQEFTTQPVWKRILIVLAGPGFNLIFTVAALWLMFMLGRPDTAPVVTSQPHSMAAVAGIKPGDRILSIGGRDVATWSDSVDAVNNAMLDRSPLPLTVRDATGTLRQLVLPLDKLPPGQTIDQYSTILGLELAPSPAVAATVLPDHPAALGGMQAGDRILSIDGKPVPDYSAVGNLVRQGAVASPKLAIVVERNGKTVPLQVVAKYESLQGQSPNWVIGIGAQPLEAATLRYGPVRALHEALVGTGHNLMQTFGMVGKMLGGEASPKNLSSVIGIAQIANATAQAGPAWFLWFLAMVSLNLAVLNLLPIPVLDGGHLLYYLIELLKGSPLSEQATAIGQYIGLVLLFSLMGLVFYNDIHRLLLS